MSAAVQTPSWFLLRLAFEEWAHLSWYSRVSLRCWMRGTWNFKMKYCFNLCRETSLWAFVKVLRANKFGKLEERKMSHSLHDYTGTACYFVLLHASYVCRVSSLLMLLSWLFVDTCMVVLLHTYPHIWLITGISIKTTLCFQQKYQFDVPERYETQALMWVLN